jgi:hypothetical protein
MARFIACNNYTDTGTVVATFGTGLSLLVTVNE